MDFIEASIFLEQFEKEEFGFLRSLDIDGYNSWFLVKKALYFNLTNNRKQPQKKQPQKRFKVLFSNLQEFWKLIKFSSKENLDTVVIERQADLIKGEMTNIYFHPLLVNPDHRFVGLSQGLLKTAYNIPQLNIENLKMLKLFSLTKLFRLAPIIKSHSNQITRRLDQFLAKKEIKISEDTQLFLRLVLSDFIRVKEFYKIIFKSLKVKNLLCIDSIPSGLIGAGRECGMVIVEFQHGFFERYKPDYMIPARYIPIMESIPIPQYVSVFGNFHKECMLSTGFWQPDQILSFGKYSVPHNKKTENCLSKGLRILFAMQVSMFEEGVTVLQELITHKHHLKGITFVLRCHPRETANNIAIISKMSKENPNLLEISKESRIFDEIQKSHFVMSFFSTAIIDALGEGVPAITLPFGDSKRGILDHIPIDLEEILIAPKGIKELIELLLLYLADKEEYRLLNSLTSQRKSNLIRPCYQQNIQKIYSTLQV